MNSVIAPYSPLLSLVSFQEFFIKFQADEINSISFKKQENVDVWRAFEHLCTFILSSSPTSANEVSTSISQSLRTMALNCLHLFASRLTPTVRYELTVFALANCPFPSVQAMLVQKLKDDVHKKQSPLSHNALLLPFLLRLLRMNHTASASAEDMDNAYGTANELNTQYSIDVLIATANLIRYLMIVDKGADSKLFDTNSQRLLLNACNKLRAQSMDYLKSKVSVNSSAHNPSINENAIEVLSDILKRVDEIANTVSNVT
jgi:hypothetical protein